MEKMEALWFLQNPKGKTWILIRIMVVFGCEPPPPQPLKTRDYLLDANILYNIQMGNASNLETALVQHLAYGGGVLMGRTTSHEAANLKYWYQGQEYNVNPNCLDAFGQHQIRSFQSARGSASARTLVLLTDDKNFHMDVNVGAMAIGELLHRNGWPSVGAISSPLIFRGHRRALLANEADTPPPPGASGDGSGAGGSGGSGGSGKSGADGGAGKSGAGGGAGKSSAGGGAGKSGTTRGSGKSGAVGGKSGVAGKSGTVVTGQRLQGRPQIPSMSEEDQKYFDEYEEEILEGHRVRAAAAVLASTKTGMEEFVCDEAAATLIESSSETSALFQWASAHAAKGNLFLVNDAGRTRTGNDNRGRMRIKWGRLPEQKQFPSLHPASLSGEEDTRKFHALVHIFSKPNRFFVSGDGQFLQKLFISVQGRLEMYSAIRAFNCENYCEYPYLVLQVIDDRLAPAPLSLVWTRV